MKARKNTLPVAPFNLRERGPTSHAELTKELGFYRFAHGVGADYRATVDPAPCPHCQGKVEWALTYKRDESGAELKFVPYLYARCRRSPKSHRWDFTHWVAVGKPDSVGEIMPVEATPAPMPKPSIGTATVFTWVDRRVATLQQELEQLNKIRSLANELVNGMIQPHMTPPSRPNQNGKAV